MATNFSWVGSADSSSVTSLGLQFSWIEGNLYLRPYSANDAITWQGEAVYVRPAFDGDESSWLQAYSINIPLRIDNYEPFVIQVSLQVQVFDDYRLDIPLQVQVFDDYQLDIPLQVQVFEDYQLDIPLSITVEPAFLLTIPLQVQVFDDYQLSVPLQVQVIDVYSVEVPLQVNVFENHTVGIPLHVDVTPREIIIEGGGVVYLLRYGVTLDIAVEYRLAIPISTTRNSAQRKLSIPLGISKFAVTQITVPLSVQVRQPQYALTIPLSVSKFNAFLRSVPLQIAVIPTGVVDGEVQLPEGKYQYWSLKVILKGIDVSERLTGTVSIDAEESSARIAVFSLKPAQGSLNPYGWVKASVEIYYVLKGSDEGTLADVLIFNGIVDTPVYDTTSRLTEFTCTDELQSIVNKMTTTEIDSATHYSSYSQEVFGKPINNWQYLLDRTSTYRYAFGLDLNRKLVVYDWQAAESSDYEFTNATILDGSLSLTLANAREIVNTVNVSVSIQSEMFRESKYSVEWADYNYGQFFPSWTFAGASMPLDALSSAGVTFQDDPYFSIQPPSHQGSEGIVSYNEMNYGTDLLLIGFRAAVSKRFTKSVAQKQTVKVQDLNSVTQLGELTDEVSIDVNATVPDSLREDFTKVRERTVWLCSAGTGLVQGREQRVNFANDPLLFVSDGSSGGWVPYPLYSVSYNLWDNSSAVAGSLLQYQKRLLPDGSTSTSISTNGEYLYDFSQFVTEGGSGTQKESQKIAISKAIKRVLETHRQNRVSFTTPIFPRVHRGNTVRVSTSTLAATGMVYQVTHTFDIDQGSALTNVTLAVSSSNALGLPEIPEGSVPETIDKPKVPVTSQTYHAMLITDYTGAGSANYNFSETRWGGHFTNTNAQPSEFVVEFPGVPEENTEAAEVTTSLDAINVAVPNDELSIFA